ncbi:MAG: YerC/YecD family TrpR-related protein [Candidatus Uhrbacteria bacterium]
MQWKNKQSEALFQAILSLKTTKEAENFFRDLLTAEEIIEFSKRWQAARLLHDRVPYIEIQKQTGLSSRTIARISKWLNKGMTGYKTIIKRVDHHGNSSSPEKSSA